MERRAFLAGTAAVGSPLISGCVIGEGATDSTSPTADRLEPASSSSITGPDGEPPDICGRTPNPDLIPAVVEPSFGVDWPSGLPDRELVIGLERAGIARAYPLAVLLRSEIVNDRLDLPVAVTYCVLCQTAVVAVRRVQGRTSVFENTGHTWRAPDRAGQEAIASEAVVGASVPGWPGSSGPTNDRNLVLFDRATGSFWSQLLGQAICGPATGERLTLLPSTFTQWGPWREAHPDTEVLLPPPIRTRDDG